MSATRVATLVWVSRKRITSESRPVRLRKSRLPVGVGERPRVEHEVRVPGMPRLKPNDSKLIDSRPALRCSTRL